MTTPPSAPRARPQVYAVIHHLDTPTMLNEANVAAACGVDGIFLIAHDGLRATDKALPRLAHMLKLEHRRLKIGINLLTMKASEAVIMAADLGLDMAWADYAGVDSASIHGEALALSGLARRGKVAMFAGVAFKGQRDEPLPAKAADNARKMGFVPTTSGLATGIPPSVEKLRAMSYGGTQPLAVASGMTPENVAGFAPYLTHILVATGVSRDMHHFDDGKLRAFMDAVQ